MSWEKVNNRIAAAMGFGNNEVIRSEDGTYYISYQPYCADNGNSETAICIKEPWKCLILFGDHREAYVPILNDLEACKKYWSDHKDQQSPATDTLD